MSFRFYKLIGNGLQFNVYRIDENRVFKKPTTRSQKISLLKKWGVKNSTAAHKQMLEAEKNADRSLHKLKKIIKNINPEIIGNPIFLKHLNYTQDIALPLGSYFTQHSFKENKVTLNANIENIFQTWRFGFSDKVFNFTINNGVRNGRVILLDLGELSFSKKEIERLIDNKIWLNQWSYLYIKNIKLKKYFATLMNSRITTTALKKNWRINLR